MRLYSVIRIEIVGLLFWSFILIGCSKHKEGPCSGPGHSEGTEVKLGVVRIDSSFRQWICPKDESIKFRNSNSAVFIFTVSKVLGAMDYNFLKWGPEQTLCNGDVKKYCDVETDYVSYKNVNVPFAIYLDRSINIEYTDFVRYQDSTLQKSEYIKFSIGWEGFQYLVSDTSKSYHPAYILLDSSYSDVLECVNTKSGSALYPTKFLLQKNVGLIGFVLSNGETWARR